MPELIKVDLPVPLGPNKKNDDFGGSNIREYMSAICPAFCRHVNKNAIIVIYLKEGAVVDYFEFELL